MSYTTKYSSILRHFLVSQNKGSLKFRKHPSVNVSKKQLLQIFWKPPNKTSMVDFFFSTLTGLPGSFLLFTAAILQRICQCLLLLDGTPQQTLSQEFSRILITRKVEGYCLQACNLLKRKFISELFLEVFKNFKNTCKKFYSDVATPIKLEYFIISRKELFF